MSVTFYNTRTRQKEDFIPLQDGKAGIYSCGPTVYHHAHLGNMRANIFADLLRRVMEHAGYDVTHVMNITDVGHLVSDDDEGEDKMEVGKKREGLDAWGIAEKYTESFFDHCHKLNILTPHIVCKATEHIEQQIALIQKLEDRGLAYVIDDGVYFDTSKFEAYGAMAKLDIEGLEGGKRISDIGKKHKTDFALWKFSPKDSQRDMEWDSPWGKGFPGWHVECSAMSMHYLGEQFDIHSGGIDHIPIHHTNEIAQSEAATGKKPFVNVWLHNEFLQFGDDVKMSKSKGDTLTVDSLEDRGYDPLAFRYLMLTAHYRNPVKFTWEALDGAASTLKRLRKQALDIKHNTESSPAEDISETAALYITKFDTALFDDLNSAVALAELHSMLGDARLDDFEKMALLMYFEPVLHLGLFEEQEAAAIPAEIIEMASQRKAAREDRNWAEADRLRAEIAKQGFDVMDSDDGFEVFKK
ncbi:MAG: cysteine--tRNA ligase [Pseudomonadota bacterium]